MEKRIVKWIEVVLLPCQRPLEQLSVANCLDRSFGSVLQRFSYAALEALLELTDEELLVENPSIRCPLDAAERQTLKVQMKAHLISCASCMQEELHHEAKDVLIIRQLRGASPALVSQ